MYIPKCSSRQDLHIGAYISPNQSRLRVLQWKNPSNSTMTKFEYFFDQIFWICASILAKIKCCYFKIFFKTRYPDFARVTLGQFLWSIFSFGSHISWVTLHQKFEKNTYFYSGTLSSRDTTDRQTDTTNVIPRFFWKLKFSKI